MSKANLPAAVLALAKSAGVPPRYKNSVVRLRQSGRIKRSLGTESWLSFNAEQIISTCACLFDWRARAGPFGMILARDILTETGGQFDILAFGVIPIARAERNSALKRGELMRYLAELAWAPDAILSNHSLDWRQDGAAGLSVRAGANGDAAEISLTLDGDGRIIGAYAPDRPRSDGGAFLPTPWRGQFSDYRYHQSRWIPFAGEVAWQIDGAWETYFQGRIEQWQAG